MQWIFQLNALNECLVEIDAETLHPWKMGIGFRKLDRNMKYRACFQNTILRVTVLNASSIVCDGSHKHPERMATLKQFGIRFIKL